MQKRCKGLLVLLDNKNKRTKKIIKGTGRVILNEESWTCPLDYLFVTLLTILAIPFVRHITFI